MQPNLLDHSLVKLKRQLIYVPGDVVAYLNSHEQWVIHRFLGYVPWRDGLKVVTRADNATRCDPLTRPAQLLGRVVAAGGQPFHPRFKDRVKAVSHYFSEIGRWFVVKFEKLKRSNGV